MALFHITADALIPVSRTLFENEALRERQDIQRLIKNNISALDKDLLIIAEEYGEFEESRRRIDLLAVDKQANLVVIELKLEKFQAAHKGQMELYLNWLDKYERREHEEAPIGLILCTETDSEHIELMNLERDNIRVAEYLTQLPALELLRERLHHVIEVARAREEDKT